MKDYLILQHPGHNRVYYKSSVALVLAELTLASSKLNVQCHGVAEKTIKGVRYFALSVNEGLSEDDVALLSRLSFFFAMYEAVEKDGELMLLPIAQADYQYVDAKISTLLKYQGKTNELFTKMMINVGLLSSDFTYQDNIHLLDPVAGRGTTLYEGIVYGFNVTGVEVDAVSTDSTSQFFKKYLRDERYKHNISKRAVTGKSKHEAVYAEEFEYARDKADYKKDETRKHFNLVNGPSQKTGSYFKAKTFNLIVGDLPYGIAHGNTSKTSTGSITRNPSELVADCLPQWHKVLKKGGALVLAWNSFLISHHDLSHILEEKGFSVFTASPYLDFEHMVDKSIKRDIIVAVKK